MTARIDMDADADDPVLGGESATPKPRRLLVGVTGLVCFLAGGALGDRLLGPTVAPLLAARATQSADAEAQGGPGSLHLIDNLVVNPAGSRGTRFLLATVAVQVAAEPLVAEVADQDVVLRSALLLALGSMTVDELTDIAQRPVVMERLRESIVDVLGAGVVRDVFVPQFVIQ